MTSFSPRCALVGAGTLKLTILLNIRHPEIRKTQSCDFQSAGRIWKTSEREKISVLQMNKKENIFSLHLNL